MANHIWASGLSRDQHLLLTGVCVCVRACFACSYCECAKRGWNITAYLYNLVEGQGEHIVRVSFFKRNFAIAPTTYHKEIVSPVNLHCADWTLHEMEQHVGPYKVDLPERTKYCYSAQCTVAPIMPTAQRDNCLFIKEAWSRTNFHHKPVVLFVYCFIVLCNLAVASECS